ncbi:MAG: AMP-binding protein [Planctomycetota bacterium]|nr:AMP-binding protein [Planctomycetota bacterium]
MAPGGERLDRGELVGRITTLHARLADAGARDGEPVLALVPDGPGTALCALACASRFAYPPVNPRTPEKELSALLEHLAPCLILVSCDEVAPAAPGRAPTLDEALRARLSERLGVPAVLLRMTVATSQIAVQPFEGCKTGSCGKIVGPRVRLIDGDGEDVACGEIGEVWIGGENVVRGYHRGESLESFAGEWFRTGDLGRLGGDGFLFLVGRSKNQISRGGEMIEPREVETALEAHRGVLEAAVLGVEDERLGEDLAALVVREGDGAEAGELKSLVRDRLVLHKVPRRIRFVEALPHNATGKLVRPELPTLWTSLEAEPESSSEPAELGPRAPALEAISKRLLGVGELDLDTDFLDLGGGSLLFEEMLALVLEELGVTLDSLDLAGAITLRTLAAALKGGDPGPFVVARTSLAAGGPPLWLFPPAGGHLTTMGRLAQRLDWPGPILALDDYRAGLGYPGSDPTMGWSAHATPDIEAAGIAGNHFTIWDDENLDATAAVVSAGMLAFVVQRGSGAGS